jgi:hypothetical protein
MLNAERLLKSRMGLTEHDEAMQTNALIARQLLGQIFDPSFNLGQQALRVNSPTVNMQSPQEIFGSEPFEVVDVGFSKIGKLSPRKKCCISESMYRVLLRIS